MTVRYAIVAFPVLDAAAAIEATRRRFDPLASTLPAHVTLVFPFTDAVGEADLAAHVARAVADQPAFDISLSGITAEDGGYIFLGVETGADVLRTLHDRLYRGVLAPHLSSAHEYQPHITIGRLRDPEEVRSAAAEARRDLAPSSRGRINGVALFRLTETGRGDVALTVDLVPTPRRPVPNER
jgi:2'-5' RNA ligase